MSPDEQLAEVQGRQWRANPAFAARLDDVAEWLRANAASPLVDVLGWPRDGEWTDGQLFAAGQLLAHLRAGDLLLAEVELAAAGKPVPSRELLQAALGSQAEVHTAVDETLFLRARGLIAPVRQLWAPVPATRSLMTPSTIPLLLGSVPASRVLGELRASTAVARWPAGQRTLSVLLTHPGGQTMHVRYP
ncbi:hypothetical protein [Lentzea sp. NBRC 102530]|uniref:hypothetical protein n=1 Tax=Lentzea sp. NBRC 102530 TaxID=3032201 RepID=UPI0024A36021|nr:hypothetical protein [Lentzea sp. NBRC 102530]GLY54849.1 hypothetical protein Lesp01_85040 [Lentzea sp. NBRC 102530]